MNVPDITEVKKHLDELKAKGLISNWELPYENLLTRLTAAIFFLDTADESKLDETWKELGKHPRFAYRNNEEQTLSKLPWRVEFNEGFEL